MINGASSVKPGTIMAMLERLANLKGKAVYVGIPKGSKPRKADKSGREPPTNAELLYIHTHGVLRNKVRMNVKANMRRGLKYSDALAMYMQAHGSPIYHVPPRPVIEPAIKAHSKELAELYKNVFRAAARGDDAGRDRALKLMGMKAQNVCRDWFTDPRNHWAPNSPITIRMKGSSNPLIDTGSLRKAIIYVIRED